MISDRRLDLQIDEPMIRPGPHSEGAATPGRTCVGVSVLRALGTSGCARMSVRPTLPE
jgi:hypothetical protein